MLDAPAEHVQRRRLALVEGHVPVLDAHRAAVDRTVVLADVAGGEDAGHRALEAARATHPSGVAQLEPRRAGEHDVRHHAGTHDHAVAVERPAALGDHPLHAPLRALEAVELVTAVHLDAVLFQHTLKEAADLPSEGALEGHVLHHQDGALHAKGSGQRRRHFAADVAPPDQHGPLGLLGVRPDRFGVAEGPQVVDAVERGTVGSQPADVGARRQQRRVELDLVLCGQRGDPLAGVELHDARAREQLDVLLAPPFVRTEQHLLLRLLAAQVALRQRRAVVGRIELAADQEHAPVGALLAQPAGAVGRGQAATDEQVIDLAAGHRVRQARRRSGRRSAPSRSTRDRRLAPAAPRRRPAPRTRRGERSRPRHEGSR